MLVGEFNLSMPKDKCMATCLPERDTCRKGHLFLSIDVYCLVYVFELALVIHEVWRKVMQGVV